MDRGLPAPSGETEMEMNPLRAELHDLCQPLTALQCRLEISRIAERGDRFEEVIEDALQQTRRIFTVVERMRSRLAQEENHQGFQHSAARDSATRAASQ